MISYNRGDIVVVPFPFTDTVAAKPRPAVVISNRSFNRSTGHTLLMMITSSNNAQWPSDYRLRNQEKAGLIASSIIRFKVFTLDNRIIKKKIGLLSRIDKQHVFDKIQEILT
jgi:mRNA interferase MazF